MSWPNAIVCTTRMEYKKPWIETKGSALMSYLFVTKGKNYFASEQPLVYLP